MPTIHRSLYQTPALTTHYTWMATTARQVSFTKSYHTFLVGLTVFVLNLDALVLSLPPHSRVRPYRSCLRRNYRRSNLYKYHNENILLRRTRRDCKLLVYML